MFAFYIASRYIRSKRSKNVITIINYITGLVILVAAAAMVIVLSGFGGLKNSSLSMIDAFEPDLSVLPKLGKTFMVEDTQIKRLANLDGILGYSKVIEERAFLSFKNKRHIAYIKGVDSLYLRVNKINNSLHKGFWDINDYRVVIGGGISDVLGIGIQDGVNFLKIIVPKHGLSPLSINDYNQMYTAVSGIYRINTDIDKKYIFTDIRYARELLKLKPNEVSAVELKLKPKADEAHIKKGLAAIFGNGIKTLNRIEANDTLYKMLNTEQIAIYLIFVLIIIIALFNLVGATIIMILDKKKDLKTLYCMGLRIPQLRNIFFIQGLCITTIFSISGIFIGLAICGLQIKYGFIHITPLVPYPMEIAFVDCVLVFLVIFSLGAVASKIASLRITKKDIANNT